MRYFRGAGTYHTSVALFFFVGVLFMFWGEWQNAGVLKSIGVATAVASGMALVLEPMRQLTLASLREQTERLQKTLREYEVAVERSHSLLDNLQASEVLNIFPSRRAPSFEEEVRRQTAACAGDLWVSGVTSSDFFARDKDFFPDIMSFLENPQQQGTVHAIVGNPNSDGFKTRAAFEFDCPLADRDKPEVKQSLLYTHWNDAHTALSILQKSPVYGKRVCVHYYDIVPQVWLLMTDKVLLIQPYHWGVPEHIQRRQGGVRAGRSHSFPVLEFAVGSAAYKTIQDHCRRVTTELCSTSRPA